MEVVEFADKLPMEAKNIMVDLVIIILALIFTLLYWEYKDDIHNGLNK